MYYAMDSSGRGARLRPEMPEKSAWFYDSFLLHDSRRSSSQ